MGVTNMSGNSELTQARELAVVIDERGWGVQD